MTERFYTDGQYVMQDGEVYVVCSGEHSADVVATALNDLLEENEQLLEKNEQLRDKLSKYDSIAEKICEWDFDEIVKVMNAQQETEKENEQLKQTIKTIKKLCNQNRIPSLLTTYIPVNCEKRKGCLDNHMVNASNMGKSNLAREILKMIDGVFE